MRFSGKKEKRNENFEGLMLTETTETTDNQHIMLEYAIVVDNLNNNIEIFDNLDSISVSDDDAKNLSGESCSYDDDDDLDYDDSYDDDLIKNAIDMDVSQNFKETKNFKVFLWDLFKKKSILNLDYLKRKYYTSEKNIIEIQNELNTTENNLINYKIFSSNEIINCLSIGLCLGVIGYTIHNGVKHGFFTTIKEVTKTKSPISVKTEYNYSLYLEKFSIGLNTNQITETTESVSQTITNTDLEDGERVIVITSLVWLTGYLSKKLFDSFKERLLTKEKLQYKISSLKGNLILNNKTKDSILEEEDIVISSLLKKIFKKHDLVDQQDTDIFSILKKDFINDINNINNFTVDSNESPQLLDKYIEKISNITNLD